MRKFFGKIFKKISEMLLEKGDYQATPIQENVIIIEETPPSKLKKTPGKNTKNKPIEILSSSEKSLRDFSEMMENPFLALSKKRKSPIIYESSDGTRKIKVTRHTNHFLASIYDWDIIIFVANKIQKILNSMSDIPPRTIVFPRHEILKYLHRHDGKKQQKDLENSLHRLKRTAIDTTIRNEDGRYKSDFGFIDSWEYTERKDKKEIRVTLSQWLYDGICTQGVLLKVAPAYFDLTSAFKRFLYRTARKHLGKNQNSWEFSVEKLYEKSGSESEFKVFKNKLKSAVFDNDIPDYYIEWIERNGKAIVVFRDEKVKRIENFLEGKEEIQQKTIGFKKIDEEAVH